jgi:hypothetical protein
LVLLRVVPPGPIWAHQQFSLFPPNVAVEANAKRCERMHCYITRLLFLMRAVFILFCGVGIVPLRCQWLKRNRYGNTICDPQSGGRVKLRLTRF